MSVKKPSQACKDAGLKNMVELVCSTGESVQTLINWHRDKPRRFELILKGVIAEKQKQ